MKISIAVFLFVAAIALGGCATRQDVRPWWTLVETNFTTIAPATTKEEVERRVGNPINTLTFSNLGEEVWDYRYLDLTRKYVAEVHFDMQGRTKYVVTYPDRCPMGPDGCR